MNFTQPRKKLFNISSQVLVRRWKEKRHRKAWERRAWGGENIQTHSTNVLSNMIQLKPLLRDGKQAPCMLHIGNTWSNDSPCSPPTLRRDKLSLNVSHSPSGNDVRARPASTHRTTKFFKSSITKDKHSDTYADRRHWASRPCCRTTQIPFERAVRVPRGTTRRSEQWDDFLSLDVFTRYLGRRYLFSIIPPHTKDDFCRTTFSLCFDWIRVVLAEIFGWACWHQLRHKSFR